MDPNKSTPTKNPPTNNPTKKNKKKKNPNTKINNTNNNTNIKPQEIKVETLPSFENVEIDVKDDKGNHKFWETQPVQYSLGSDNKKEFKENAPIQTKTLEQVQKEPFKLPDQCVWFEPDLTNPEMLNEIYLLLTNNYVEDDDAMFRFDYSTDFLKWALMPPGWRKEWHLGIKYTKTNKFMAFISAIPAKISMYSSPTPMVEINYLCVHKKLRSKGLAPILIQEITRRVNLTNVWQAVYTSGTVLPNPVASCRYYHRSLNPKKLIDIKFSYLKKNMTMSMTIKLFSLPEKPQTPGIRALEKKDIPQACQLLSKFLSRYHMYPHFNEEEFEHWFLPRKEVIYSYVVESKNGDITDFVSFYNLPSTILKHPKHKLLKAAYSFYNFSFKTDWVDLMRDALIFARNENFDVFNCLDLMENEKFLKPLKFGSGDGNLLYYLFNWKCPLTKPQGIGLVLM
eukprot:TRINITY_DN8733_c0_g1_i1.p1 TRINITY_DN8733_c0_g1~~TRINITY_DN8733_c0_g1_i1.p1  ORF type:complete len:453 (-),score=129.79 TRINITY_DN8733_c0_g1_i1:75-1433(-)